MQGKEQKICEACGQESTGTYSEGGHKWHVCAQCYGEYVERYSASEGPSGNLRVLRVQ